MFFTGPPLVMHGGFGVVVGRGLVGRRGYSVDGLGDVIGGIVVVVVVGFKTKSRSCLFDIP